MIVPKNVADQGKLADELQQAVIKDATTPDTGTDPLLAPTVDPVKGTPIIPAGPNTIVPSSTTPDLEQKYKSLLGRVEAQAQELAVAKANNDLLYRQLADANRNALSFEAKFKEAEDKSKETPEESPPNSKLIDVNQISKYGPEFKDMAEKINAVLSGVTPAPKTEPAKEPVVSPGIIDLSVFRTQIIADVWATKNLNYGLMDNSDLFKGWLKKFDPVSGKQNSADWFESIGVRDKAGCLRVIHTFLSTPDGVQYLNSLKPATPAPGTPPNPQPDLKPLVNDPLKLNSTGEIWTTAKVNQFYKDMSLGKYKSRSEEAKRIEQDIFAAQNDGRWQG